jgi:hypothetical protein
MGPDTPDGLTPLWNGLPAYARTSSAPLLVISWTLRLKLEGP